MPDAELGRTLAPLIALLPTTTRWIKRAGAPPVHQKKPLTQDLLARHVNGGPAFGLAPIPPGTATTQVALLDFDNHRGQLQWAEMALAASVVSTQLRNAGLEPVLFRSSGGHGIHLYILWDAPQDAASVRKTLRDCLADCGYSPGTGGVAKRQIEIFPKQDAVPVGSFGSMFMLPLAGESVPLDDLTLEPLDKTYAHHLVWHKSRPVPVIDRTPVPSTTKQPTPELQTFKSALDALPNSGEHTLDYDAWRNCIFAIHHATGGSDEGLEWALEFSARSPKDAPEFLRHRVWPYIKPDHSTEHGPVTANYVLALARQYGWREDVMGLFDALPATPDTFTRAQVAAEAEQAPVHKYPVVAASEFARGQPPGWIIKNVLPRAELIVLFGDSGSGKSFLALDLAMAITRGVPWRGSRTTPGRVVYLAAEGAGGMRKRLVAHAQHHGIELDGIPLGVISGSPNLLDKADALDVAKAILMGGPVSLVIVDTFAQVMPGANENSGEDVGLALAHCKGIHRATGATVLLVHHSGKDSSKGARGWSGLRAAADAELEVTRTDTVRVARVSKQKDGDDHGQWGFDLTPVNIGVDEDGDVITSCVVVEADIPVEQPAGRRALQGRWERLVTAVIDEIAESQTVGIEADYVIAEAVRRAAKPAEGERDVRKQLCTRALKKLCDGDDAPYLLTNGCIELA